MVYLSLMSCHLKSPRNVMCQALKLHWKTLYPKWSLFQQKSKEIRMCSDGAAVTCAVYNLLHEEMGDYYLIMICLPHKFELAINDAFTKSLLNGSTESDYSDVYFLKNHPGFEIRVFCLTDHFWV